MIPYLNTALAKVAGILAIGIVIGLTINAWRLGAQLSALESDHSAQMLSIARMAAAASHEAVRQQRQSINNVAEIDRKYTDEIEQARIETDLLRNAVASGERRLRISASCPVPASSVPDASTASGMDDAPGPRLTDASERDYWLLRDRITLITNQVSALQGYVTNSCLQGAR